MYAPDEGGTAANGLHLVKAGRIGYVAGADQCVDRTHGHEQ